MKSRYDIIIVGGGPAGAWTAKHAAERGMSVLLLEKDREIGIPVRCGEGVIKSSLEKLVPIQKEWIAQEVTSLQLIAPDETVVDLAIEETGVILHRKVFDHDLAGMASDAGVEVVTEAYVHGLLSDNGSITGVQVNCSGKEFEVSSSIVIGADGVESRVGRWGGLKTHLPLNGIGSCAQMLLSEIDIDPSCVQFYFGKEIAPEGYLWLFPKGKRMANVGLGQVRHSLDSKTALESLKTFVNKKFKDHTMLSCIAGGVPAVPTLKEIVGNGLMLVGDAAHQEDPISGGGIINAMIAGQIAGEVAAEAVRGGDVSKKQLKVYEKRWHKTEGKNAEVSYQISKVKNRFSDEELNRLAVMLNRIPPEKRTVVQIFKTALIHHPKLILDAIRLYAYLK
jgi:digeranylgeranylglycerophospholipid reductase